MPSPTLVIGAGVSGLVCAIELHRAGREVLVVDAAPDVGGRVRTTVRDGLVLDHGFQVLFTAYPTLRGYLDYDALQLRRFQPAARIVANGKVSLIGDALKDPSVLVNTVLATAIGVSDKLRLLTLRRFAQGLSFDDCFSPAYANVSTRDFLYARGFSEQVVADFFAPFYGGILLDRALTTTASVLLFTFKMLAEGDTVVPAAGMGAITQQLAAQLPAGAVRTGVRVQQLTTSTDARGTRVTGVQLADGTTMDAAHVVLATDAPTAMQLARSATVSLPEPVEALGCTTAYYTARRTPIPGKALWLNADAGAVISHAVTLTDVAPEYASGGRTLIAATAVGAPATLADDAFDRAAQAELCAMGGLRADEAQLERVGLWRVPYAQFAQPPGWREQRPAVACGMAGLWRASEVLHSSSLEGAARGGLTAAQALLYTA
jgi:protoporphyrinogen oxidase